MPKVEVRRMTLGETGEAARLHARELPHEFLSRFGPGFLSRYYRAFVESPYAVALVASVEENGTLDGIFIGTFDTGAHYSYLVRRHGPGLALATARQALGEPRLAGDLLRTRLLRYIRGIFRSLRYAADGGEKGVHGRKQDQVGFAAYVAVSGERRGYGIGGRLFESYEELAREAGLRKLELVTLPDERGAGPFFDGLGWKRKGEITSRSGESYTFFTKSLGD